MRSVVQRVRSASVEVEGQCVGRIGQGLLALVGSTHGDDEKSARYIASKLVGLRIFPDEAGKMNLSVKDIGGSILLVSQFTLYGDCRKGRRPSFVSSQAPDIAEPLIEQLRQMLVNEGVPVETGVFGADMKVELLNDGPVTLLLESDKSF